MPGLKFQKLDLHTHTPASKCYNSPEHTAEFIVQTALSCGLAAIAITDHNTAAWIDGMKRAAQGTPLVIFPGVELSLHEGYHLVCLFDPSTTQKDVENFLGGVGITAQDYGQQDALCKKSDYDVMKVVHERGGLVVLAHIDGPKGAFKEKAKIREDGKIGVPVDCRDLFNTAEYDAVECIAGRLPDGFDAIHQMKRIPAFYQASDNPDPVKPTKHSADGLGTLYSWFKLDRIDLEGLRQCFADPEVRIRLMDEKGEVGHPNIVSMSIGGAGFLRNQYLEFHDGLNSIIGGKGVGKSLAVEFLRFALDQPSTDPNLTDDLSGKLEKRLEPGNSIEVVYQIADGTQYKIRRTYQGIPRGRGARPNSTCTCTNLTNETEYMGDIAQMFPILAYSQTEVIKIAENPQAQLELIDRFVDTREYERAIAEIEARLAENDVRLTRAIQAKGALDSCELEISTLIEKIAEISRSLADPLFDAMKAAEAKKRALEARQTYMQELIAQVQSWRAQAASQSLAALPEGLEADHELNNVQEQARKARQQTLDSLKNLLKALEGESQAIATTITTWLPTFNQVEANYQALLAQIGGDRKAKEQERKRLEEQRTALEAQANAYQELTKALPKVLEARNRLLDDLERAYLRFYELRKNKFDQLTDLSKGKLKLALEHAGDRADYEAKLSDMLKGGQNAPSVSDRNKIAQNVVPRRLIELVLDHDAVKLTTEAGITELWAGRAIEKLWSSPEFVEVLALQHNCYPTDIPTIRFRKEGNQYDPLNELSVGQKCTALLIIALCDGTMPIVIDQPEDALDIISVWEDIAKQLRRGKSSRQFILTTHDSTVAVSADSDQFIVLRAGATYGKVVFAGAIDREDVREAVIKHLEGGPEPYKLRSRKYNMT